VFTDIGDAAAAADVAQQRQSAWRARRRDGAPARDWRQGRSAAQSFVFDVFEARQPAGART
jgi:hypothetical protein